MLGSQTQKTRNLSNLRSLNSEREHHHIYSIYLECTEKTVHVTTHEVRFTEKYRTCYLQVPWHHRHLHHLQNPSRNSPLPSHEPPRYIKNPPLYQYNSNDCRPGTNEKYWSRQLNSSSYSRVNLLHYNLPFHSTATTSPSAGLKPLPQIGENDNHTQRKLTPTQK